jgi:hypothetical protein
MSQKGLFLRHKETPKQGYLEGHLESLSLRKEAFP